MRMGYPMVGIWVHKKKGETRTRLCCPWSFWLGLQQPIDTRVMSFQSWLMIALSPVVSHMFWLFFFIHTCQTPTKRP
jgi:hypothetical protein